MADYIPSHIEPKWQKIWQETGAFCAEKEMSKPKYYTLIEFPYPSGAGLHVGHPRSNTALDIIARKRRMEGYNVLYPIGWDAFGLPTENYAIKNRVHPKKVTQENIDRFRTQLQSLGFSFDYTREVNTTDPAYYKWTQWIFLKLFERGLAYKSEMPINWCLSCKCGLANEEVVGGVCERCGGVVERRVKSQWMLKITAYAQRLLDDLDDVDYIEKVKTQQRNWIGRSEGAKVYFSIADTDETLTVYTTRPDTLFGATYMVISPEHPLVEKMAQRIGNIDDVLAYRSAAALKSDFERSEMALEKTGVCLEGLSAINPVNAKRIPIFVSDYVLMGYGTGAIMAVPGHDSRDWAFAKKFDLPIIEVVSGGDVTAEAFEDIDRGSMVQSEFLNGMLPQDAKAAMTAWLEENGLGEKSVNFKLRDWVFSRQRYWGEPIPLVYCDDCGWVAVKEADLPITLPDVQAYEPTDNGESPLATCTDWLAVPCPTCGKMGRRETDTMPQWAGSSWYFLRYMDPHNDNALADKEALAYWSPVDWYNGGMEHTTLHLLYSRFWHKFLYDIGAVPTKEPYQKRTSHGMILGENGEKMSKSRGNVVNPDDIVSELGADAFRLYEMFMGAFDQAIPWSTQGARGCRRFLDRVWRLQDMLQGGQEFSAEMTTAMHQTLRKVSQDYEAMKFNTAIATMMALVNQFYEKGSINHAEMKALVLMLSPVAPHICEEIWQVQGFGKTGLVRHPWPQWDEEKCKESTVEIAVQVLGKVRGRIVIAADASQEEVQKAALACETVIPYLEGKTLQKAIYIPGRLVNLVVM